MSTTCGFTDQNMWPGSETSRVNFKETTLKINLIQFDTHGKASTYYVMCVTRHLIQMLLRNEGQLKSSGAEKRQREKFIFTLKITPDHHFLPHLFLVSQL